MRTLRGIALRWLLLCCALLLALAVVGAPKNVILMIGDGMGPDSVYAAGAYRNFHEFKVQIPCIRTQYFFVYQAYPFVNYHFFPAGDTRGHHDRFKKRRSAVVQRGVGCFHFRKGAYR